MNRNAKIEILPADDSGLRGRSNGTTVTLPPAKRAHYLRLVADNGQVLATSETYSTRQNARRAVDAWLDAFVQIAGDMEPKRHVREVGIPKARP